MLPRSDCWVDRKLRTHFNPLHATSHPEWLLQVLARLIWGIDSRWSPHGFNRRSQTYRCGKIPCLLLKQTGSHCSRDSYTCIFIYVQCTYHRVGLLSAYTYHCRWQWFMHLIVSMRLTRPRLPLRLPALMWIMLHYGCCCCWQRWCYFHFWKCCPWTSCL